MYCFNINNYPLLSFLVMNLMLLPKNQISAAYISSSNLFVQIS